MGDPQISQIRADFYWLPCHPAIPFHQVGGWPSTSFFHLRHLCHLRIESKSVKPGSTHKVHRLRRFMLAVMPADNSRASAQEMSIAKRFFHLRHLCHLRIDLRLSE
jgi:hypothetical protein